jgi:hypothetical protein
MKITDIDLIAQLERFAEACPWDTVELWISRAPAGDYAFTGYLRDSEKFGFKCIFGNGNTPSDAVDNCIKQAGDRHPEAARRKALDELRDKIAKLEAVVIGLPPYRPGRERIETQARMIRVALGYIHAGQPDLAAEVLKGAKL